MPGSCGRRVSAQDAMSAGGVVPASMRMVQPAAALRDQYSDIGDKTVWSRVIRKAVQAGLNGVRLAGVCFNSGWPEIASVIGAVRALMPALPENRRFQCIGAKSCSWGWSEVTRTRSVAWP